MQALHATAVLHGYSTFDMLLQGSVCCFQVHLWSHSHNKVNFKIYISQN